MSSKARTVPENEQVRAVYVQGHANLGAIKILEGNHLVSKSRENLDKWDEKSLLFESTS